ncbi:uncharacterized protein LOC143452929 [Clavelina lepadiformis]|uniref:uncharacterized protein LOC143452929 n=1 Tax=Clavelina lepadiformis TaxID=159417 RepID=UPI00404225A2
MVIMAKEKQSKKKEADNHHKKSKTRTQTELSPENNGTLKTPLPKTSKSDSISGNKKKRKADTPDIKKNDDQNPKSNLKPTEEQDLANNGEKNSNLESNNSLPPKKRKRKKKNIKPLPYPEPGAFEAMLKTTDMGSPENDGKIETVKPDEATLNVTEHVVSEEDTAKSNDKTNSHRPPKKQKRKKEPKTKPSGEDQDDDEKEEIKSAKDFALAYLETWRKDRNNWSFKKVRQVWLLHNLYNQDAVSDIHFNTLLDYLQGAKGSAKTKTIEDAENFFAEQDDESINNVIKQERARRIIQHLSV